MGSQAGHALGGNRSGVPVKVHVLTAVTRPWNLPLIAGSLANAAAAAGCDICWHWQFDSERRHVGGQAVKNRMLDEITDGWVWLLDDDTLVHPNLLRRARTVSGDQAVDAIVFSQARADGRQLTAAPANVRVGDIDAGQAILRRDLIGATRLHESYEGDGIFLADVLGRANAVYVDEFLSLHNALAFR